MWRWYALERASSSSWPPHALLFSTSLQYSSNLACGSCAPSSAACRLHAMDQNTVLLEAVQPPTVSGLVWEAGRMWRAGAMHLGHERQELVRMGAHISRCLRADGPVVVRGSCAIAVDAQLVVDCPVQAVPVSLRRHAPISTFAGNCVRAWTNTLCHGIRYASEAATGVGANEVEESADRDVLHGQPQRLQQLRQGALLHQALAVAHLRQLVCNALLPVSVLLLPRLPPLLRFAHMWRRLRYAETSAGSPVPGVRLCFHLLAHKSARYHAMLHMTMQTPIGNKLPLRESTSAHEAPRQKMQIYVIANLLSPGGQFCVVQAVSQVHDICWAIM